MRDPYQVVNIWFDELAGVELKRMVQILNSKLKLTIFVIGETPLKIGKGIRSIYGCCLGEILDPFQIFPKLDKNHTSLDQKLLSVGLFLKS